MLRFKSNSLLMLSLILVTLTVAAISKTQPNNSPRFRGEFAKAMNGLEQAKRTQQLLQINGVMPQAENLPDFNGVTSRSDSYGFKVLTARRKRDKATLVIAVAAYKSFQTAKTEIDLASSLSDVTGSLVKGTISGKPLGEECRHTPTGSGLKKASFLLLVRDGPSLIRLQISSFIDQDKDKQPMWDSITQADRLEVERIARLMLRKLAALGLTKATFHG